MRAIIIYRITKHFVLNSILFITKSSAIQIILSDGTAVTNDNIHVPSIEYIHKFIKLSQIKDNLIDRIFINQQQLTSLTHYGPNLNL